MRSVISMTGIVLIIFGILALAYQGFTYTTREKVAEIGPVQVTSENEKTVRLPPVLGGLSLVAGVVLVVVSRLSPPK